MFQKRAIIIGLSVLVLVGVWFAYYLKYQTSETPALYVNSVLAIRGFRHGPLELGPGEADSYDIDVGEQVKVTWRAENLSESGQLLYKGPAGIGIGMVKIPLAPTASQSGFPFLNFTPTQAGIATFTLTVTGPGPDGIYTVPSTLTVNVHAVTP